MTAHRCALKSTKYSLLLAFLLIALMGPTAARADTVATYNFTGTLTGGSSVSGQFTIDFTTDTISAFSFATPFMTVDSAHYVPFVFNVAGFLGLDFQGPDPSSDELVLWFQTPTPFNSASLFIGALPGVVAITVPLEVSGGSTDNCLDSQPPGLCTTMTGSDTFASGTATIVGAPEPASFLLLGSGLLGLIGVRRRKNLV
jgi:hypothetical protein